MKYIENMELVWYIHVCMYTDLRWQVSKLIFARAQNNHFQYGELQRLTVANGHLNVLYLVKGVCQPTFIR